VWSTPLGEAPIGSPVYFFAVYDAPAAVTGKLSYTADNNAELSVNDAVVSNVADVASVRTSVVQLRDGLNFVQIKASNTDATCGASYAGLLASLQVDGAVVLRTELSSWQFGAQPRALSTIDPNLAACRLSTAEPTPLPTRLPSARPSARPSGPTPLPTARPSGTPSRRPTSAPTSAPTRATGAPTPQPTYARQPFVKLRMPQGFAQQTSLFRALVDGTDYWNAVTSTSLRPLTFGNKAVDLSAACGQGVAIPEFFDVPNMVVFAQFSSPLDTAAPLLAGAVCAWSDAAGGTAGSLFPRAAVLSINAELWLSSFPQGFAQAVKDELGRLVKPARAIVPAFPENVTLLNDTGISVVPLDAPVGCAVDFGPLGIAPWGGALAGWTDRSAHWIWNGTAFGDSPSGTDVFIYAVLDVAAPVFATVSYTADNDAELAVNGEVVSGGSDWTRPVTSTVQLQQGSNLVVFRASNRDAPTAPPGRRLAGLLVSVSIDGGVVLRSQRGPWLASLQPPSAVTPALLAAVATCAKATATAAQQDAGDADATATALAPAAVAALAATSAILVAALVVVARRRRARHERAMAGTALPGTEAHDGIL
jgi:hypothetical protein